MEEITTKYIEDLIPNNLRELWNKTMGSGNGNSVLTYEGIFDKELSWHANLESIFRGLCIMSSQEETEGRVSFRMRRTSSSSLPIFRIAKTDSLSFFMPTL
jgi:hypothetical protein